MSKKRPLSKRAKAQLAKMKRLERIARAAGLLCFSFVFSSPRLTPQQEKLAQRIRREVPKVLDR